MSEGEKRVGGGVVQRGGCGLKRSARLGAVALACGVAGLLGSGCVSSRPLGPATAGGVATGAALGGLGGAIIGHQSGHAGEGAALGAAAGATLGGLLGLAQDAECDRVYALEEQRRRHETALALSRGAGTSDREIFEANERARRAEQEVAQVQRERAAALERARRIDEARRREAAAQQELERLKREPF